MIKVFKKQLFYILLIVLLLFDVSFSAVVSDSDGTAFVTKAEFDALKYNFATQIDSYNDSISNKIDGAIASYIAGISISKKNDVSICDSAIGYPLTLRMLGPYNAEYVRNLSTLNDGNNLWTDGYDMFFYGTRNHVHEFSMNNILKTPTNVIKNFYNGSVSGEDFIIQEICNDYNIIAKMITSIEQFGTASADVLYENHNISVCFDQNALFQTTSQSSAITSKDRSANMYADNDQKLTFPMDTCPMIWEMYAKFADVGNPSTFTTTVTGKKWNNWVASSTGNPRIECTQRKTSWKQKVSYVNSKINDIFCGSVSSTNTEDLLLPAIYDKKIHVTNINETKKDLISTKERLHTYHLADGKKDPSSHAVYVEHVIEPGYVIEPETNIKTAQPWYDSSLIKATRCKYYETWPVSKTTEKITMMNGIPLCDIESDTKSFIIKFVPTWTTFSGDTGKRIMLSKEPIVETTFTPDTSVNKDKYLDISTTSGGVKSKYVSLINGTTNEIYIDNLKKGDKIYYKVVWETGTSNNDTNYKKTVTISKPDCVAIFED